MLVTLIVLVACLARPTQPLEKPAADHTSDYPEQDIDEEALPPAFHDLAGDIARDQSEDDPAED